MGEDETKKLTEAVLELSRTLKMFLETFQGLQDELLTASQVAKMVGCSVANIEQMKFISNGIPSNPEKRHLYRSGCKRQIPCYNIGKANYRYKKEDIEAFLLGRRYRYDESDQTNKII